MVTTRPFLRKSLASYEQFDFAHHCFGRDASTVCAGSSAPLQQWALDDCGAEQAASGSFHIQRTSADRFHPASTERPISAIVGLLDVDVIVSSQRPDSRYFLVRDRVSHRLFATTCDRHRRPLGWPVRCTVVGRSLGGRGDIPGTGVLQGLLRTVTPLLTVAVNGEENAASPDPARVPLGDVRRYAKACQ